jgi:CDGSH-type Zn-finger protein
MENTEKSVKKRSDSEQRIKVSKNGPYLVSGSVPVVRQTIVADENGTALEWRFDEKYPLLERCGLCRCGHSKNKPFCDGTHLKISFVGTETADNEPYLNKPKVFEGSVIKLIDFEELCASARFCHREGGIWNFIKNCEDPRIKQIIIEESCDCPSGRLVIYDKKLGENIEPNFEKSIVAIEDPQVGISGPLWVRGGIPVESAEGRVYRVRNRITLCRCGKSQNKPFCDSSHYPEEHEHGEE